MIEAESKGGKFYEMSERELLAAATAVCLRLSKVSGCLMPTDSKEAMNLFNSVGQFLVNNKRFRRLTASEVALAASWNAAGEFPERVKHYMQQINLDYIGELLNQYCRHKQKFDLKEKLERESMKYLTQHVSEDRFFWEKQVEDAYQRYRSGTYNIGLWLPGMYACLVQYDFIAPGYFVFFLPAGYAKTIDDINQDLAEFKAQGKSTYKVHEKLAFVNEYKFSNQYVMSYARRFAVRQYYRDCVSEGRKNLFMEVKQ